MLTNEKILDWSGCPIIDYLNCSCSLEDILFFDIETTGFVAEISSLYLIGCLYYKENQLHIIQWFADDYSCEEEMLITFFNFLSSYKILINYNGNGFDIPYLLKKCKKYHKNYDFSFLESVDIYKKILPYKKIFKLDNLKQKTIEKFLNVQRKDTLEAQDLISVYGKYLRYKFSKNPQIAALYPLLLFHNEEDLKGLLGIMPILEYAQLFEKIHTIHCISLDEQFLTIELKLNTSLPRRITYGNEIATFTAFDLSLTLKILLYKQELKFFYRNYKDYYYLPEEDISIHKSIAFYVDKDFRTKAKAANCYSKKTGCFVPQYREISSSYFKIDFHDKVSYIETTDEFLQNKRLLSSYVQHILLQIIKR